MFWFCCHLYFCKWFFCSRSKQWGLKASIRIFVKLSDILTFFPFNFLFLKTLLLVLHLMKKLLFCPLDQALLHWFLLLSFLLKSREQFDWCSHFYFLGKPWINKQFLLEYCSCLSKLTLKDYMVADISYFILAFLSWFSLSTFFLPYSFGYNFSDINVAALLNSNRCCLPLIWLFSASSVLLKISKAASLHSLYS